MSNCILLEGIILKRTSYSSNPQKQLICKIINKLFISGTDVNDKDNNGNTALHLAMIYDFSSDIIDILVENGAHTTIKNNERQTPLDLAIFYANIEATKTLLKY